MLIFIFILSLLYISCASYRACSIFWDNYYYGNEFDYYGQKKKLFKGFFVQDSIEGEKKRVLQIDGILSKRENKELLIYIPRQLEKDKFIDDCEDFFNKEYLDHDSILPSSIIDFIRYSRKINKIKVREGKSCKKLKDSAVAVIIPEFSYPYKEKLLRSLVKYNNLPIYLFDDYKRRRCYILFPVLDDKKRINYYIGKLSNVSLDYVVRSKKKLIISCILIPFALTFDIITSPVQIYLVINFPDEFISKVKGF